MATDVSSLFKAVLVAGATTDLTGGGIAAGGAGTFYLNINNPTASEIMVEGIWRGTGAGPAAADLIRVPFAIEAGGWAVFRRVKMGEGMKLWIRANGPLVVDCSGRKEG